MRSMRTVWIVGPLAALTLLYSTPAGKAQQEQSLTGLEDVFAPGVFLEDRNGDGVVDFIHARIVDFSGRTTCGKVRRDLRVSRNHDHGVRV